MTRPKTVELKAIHMKIPTVLHEALSVLATLENMTLTDLFTRIGREELKRRGYAVEVTGEKIAEELERRKKAGQREA